jgi:hypothetical protein
VNLDYEQKLENELRIRKYGIDGKNTGLDGTYPVAQNLRIDPRRLMSKLLHVLNV